MSFETIDPLETPNTSARSVYRNTTREYSLDVMFSDIFPGSYFFDDNSRRSSFDIFPGRVALGSSNRSKFAYLDMPHSKWGQCFNRYLILLPSEELRISELLLNSSDGSVQDALVYSPDVMFSDIFPGRYFSDDGSRRSSLDMFPDVYALGSSYRTKFSYSDMLQ